MCTSSISQIGRGLIRGLNHTPPSEKNRLFINPKTAFKWAKNAHNAQGPKKTGRLTGTGSNLMYFLCISDDVDEKHESTTIQMIVVHNLSFSLCQ